MENVLDNLFGKKEETENGLNKALESVDDTNTQEVEENPTTEVDETTLESEPVVEQVSEVENNADEHIVEEEIVVDEPICNEVNNEPINITFEVFVADLKHILNSTQGLDFELVELKRRINNLINKYEAHN